MSALNRFEQFMENIVEGSVARMFGSPVHAAEIAKRLERAMESQQQISMRRVIVPNVYHVYLHPNDFTAFQPIQKEIEQEMGVYLSELARERSFTMLEHPQVDLGEDAAVPRRTIQVVAETSRANVEGATQVMSADNQQQPAAQSGSKALLLLETTRGTTPIPLETTLLTLGRGLDNDVVLEDSRVSRNHAQLRYKSRRFWVIDLASTNGTFVNGEPVSETALRNGDILSLGGLELIFREG
jgi:hypothetical protein